MKPDKYQQRRIRRLSYAARTELWQVDDERHTSLWRKLTPPQRFVGSFLLLVGLGTLGLKLLPGLYTGEPLSWLEALFTATSAVCVTGLMLEEVIIG